ncbi:AAA family ATPase [Pseudomonas sp. Xaverov 83]|uniref:AAA family ATPase n=1 Tax=Pseudomonas sp. Xaverov 83 TaxID=2666087 RepID=UPI001C5A8F07|nr:AAA family ATPase [Pseudomonas sp. Xaverov 83]
MKTIRLKNFRSLKDTGKIEIKPVTILLGQNSSGKSTFLRSLALLKQGIGVRAREPFLWVGDLVDFGGISETVSNFSDEGCLSFSYDFEMPSSSVLLRRTTVSSKESVENIPCSISITERLHPKDGAAAFEYLIDIENENFSFALSRVGEFVSFEINGVDYLNLVVNSLSAKVWKGPVPTFTRKNSTDVFEDFDGSSDFRDFTKALREFIDARVHGRTGEQKRDSLLYTLTRFPFSAFRLVKNHYIGDTKWRKHCWTWTEESKGFIELKNLLLGYRFLDFVNMASDYTLEVLESAKYITPLRASAERYYRKQGLAVDELDAQGANFALFLDNMSPKDRNSFSDWCESFFGVSIFVEESGGHLSLFIKSQDKQSVMVNIADTGFGFSQMFPILAQLWVVQHAKTESKSSKLNIPLIFSIEQPELHLHPKLQASLADVFVNSVTAARSIGVELKLVIETHSEYLVNRLGYLIAKSKFSSEDVSVLIFERKGYSEGTNIRHASYSSRGFLENWPYGFFEPDNL